MNTKSSFNPKKKQRYHHLEGGPLFFMQLYAAAIVLAISFYTAYNIKDDKTEKTVCSAGYRGKWECITTGKYG